MKTITLNVHVQFDIAYVQPDDTLLTIAKRWVNDINRALQQAGDGLGCPQLLPDTLEVIRLDDTFKDSD